MAKVTFLTFYNNFSVGVSVLSSLLVEAGHDVSALFFKLPKFSPIRWFHKSPVSGDAVDAYGNIVGTSIDVNSWTENEIDLLVKLIGDLSPEMLLVSARSTDRNLVKELMPKIRSRYDFTTIAGGYGPTLDPDSFADMVDYVFIGEAENRIVDLVDTIESGSPIKDFDNICYKKNGRLTKNKLCRPNISQFKSSKLPDNNYYIDNNKIFRIDSPNSIVSTHTYSTFVGRGCINSCSYCSVGNWNKVYKKEGVRLKKRRNRPLEDIINELIEMRDKRYTFVFFRDEFMFGRIDYLKEFFRLYEREINLPFWAHLYPKLILDHPDILKDAVDAGFVATEVGFQSGSDRINRHIYNRFISNEDTIRYAQLLDKYDIIVKYDFIIGNPAEDMEDIMDTFKVLQALPRRRASIEFPRLIFLDGTPIEKKLAPYLHRQRSDEYYYCLALLYLSAFVMQKDEFDKLLSDEATTSSWQTLHSIYKKYLKDHNIFFQIGTHEIPDSITTHRYQRILKKKRYSDVIVWGNGDYYKEMAAIFKGTNVRYHIDDKEKNIVKSNNILPPNIISKISEPLPIFICSSRKQEIKMKIITEYPNFPGKIFV